MSSTTRYFNKSRRTYLLRNEDRTATMTVHPLTFADIPASFHGDITFRTALKSGALEKILSAKQGAAAENKAHEGGKGGSKGGKGGSKGENKGANPDEGGKGEDGNANATTPAPEDGSQSQQGNPGSET